MSFLSIHYECASWLVSVQHSYKASACMQWLQQYCSDCSIFTVVSACVKTLHFQAAFQLCLHKMWWFGFFACLVLVLSTDSHVQWMGCTICSPWVSSGTLPQIPGLIPCQISPGNFFCSVRSFPNQPWDTKRLPCSAPGTWQARGHIALASPHPQGIWALVL